MVEAVDKKKARLNCIGHLLVQIGYDAVEREKVTAPERVYNPDYLRNPAPPEMFAPSVY